MRMLSVLLSISLLALLAGCASAPLLTESELPEGARLVAGGLCLKWKAPAEGTAIFLEANSGTIVKSESLEAGEQFSFDPSKTENVELLNRLFSRRNTVDKTPSLLPLPRNALFLLYFAPTEMDDEGMPTPLRAENWKTRLVPLSTGR